MFDDYNDRRGSTFVKSVAIQRHNSFMAEARKTPQRSSERETETDLIVNDLIN